MSGLGDLMKQAQAMQSNMEKMKRELADTEVRGQAGGGLVAITMNGQHDVRKVEIAAELMSDDKEVVEDLIAAAVNDAVRKVDQLGRDKMNNVVAGLGENLPAGILPGLKP